ncbi:hypothetical protein Glove_586g31 [Diversispora epigaea]|uniref:Uncharacterized protein n=1 Tax=Diversispora epigaea TaxID=1348612 RepID=A0A397G8A5_9GLOM|nr:hypothetical protein Glove_586g31 [Diversispora epigaea]
MCRIKDHSKWCPYCAGNVCLTLKEACTIAKKNGGRCLSNQYTNNRTPLLWQCNKLHICVGPPPANRRPEFLKTSENLNGLELDIPYYNHGFAIEVQGLQHEKYHEFFHKGDKEIQKIL